MTIRRILAIGGVAAAATLASTAHAQLIFSDNFNDEVGRLNVGTVGVNPLLRWTVTKGTVDVVPVGTQFDVYPGNGHYLDLDGSNNRVGGIRTNQVFNLAPGDYILSFDLGKYTNPVETMTFGLTGGVFSQAFSSGTGVLPSLVNQQYTFSVGGNVNTQLFFNLTTYADTANSDNRGLVLDNVSLERVVPEPSEWAAMGVLSLGLAGLVARRRRSV